MYKYRVYHIGINEWLTSTEAVIPFAPLELLLMNGKTYAVVAIVKAKLGNKVEPVLLIGDQTSVQVPQSTINDQIRRGVLAVAERTTKVKSKPKAEA